jgi:hypothetical protein
MQTIITVLLDVEPRSLLNVYQRFEENLLPPSSRQKSKLSVKLVWIEIGPE